MLSLSRYLFLLFFVSLTYQAFKFDVNRGNSAKFNQPQSQLSTNNGIAISPEDIGRYINQIRTSPSMLVPYLQDKIKNRKVNNQSAWREAISYLNGLEKIPTCNYSVVLERAAMDHVSDLVEKKSISHVGNNGGSLVERIQKYTDWNNGTASEMIAYEPSESNRNHPLQILMTIIVNENSPSKVDRNAFFNPQYRYYGVSVRMQGSSGIAVLLMSTELFKLDYPDQQSQQNKKKRISTILQGDNPVPDFFGGKKPSEIFQSDNFMPSELFGGMKFIQFKPQLFGGLNPLAFSPVQLPQFHHGNKINRGPSRGPGRVKSNNQGNVQSQSSRPKNVVSAIVTSSGTAKEGSRPPRTIKKIFDNGESTIEKR